MTQALIGLSFLAGLILGGGCGNDEDPTRGTPQGCSIVNLTLFGSPMLTGGDCSVTAIPGRPK